MKSKWRTVYDFLGALSAIVFIGLSLYLVVDDIVYGNPRERLRSETQRAREDAALIKAVRGEHRPVEPFGACQAPTMIMCTSGTWIYDHRPESFGSMITWLDQGLRVDAVGFTAGASASTHVPVQAPVR